jgi:hypothetical protein
MSQPSAVPRPSSLPGRVPLPRPTAPSPVPARGLRAPQDALQQMLAASTGWHVVPAAVSWLVTVVAWAALAVDLATAFYLAWHPLPFDLLRVIASVGGHPALVAGTASVAAAVLGVVALRTGGFRRANRAWFRVWTAGLVLSAVAVGPLVAATLLGAFVVALCVSGVLILSMALLAAFAGGL